MKKALKVTLFENLPSQRVSLDFEQDPRIHFSFAFTSRMSSTSFHRIRSTGVTVAFVIVKQPYELRPEQLHVF